MECGKAYQADHDHDSEKGNRQLPSDNRQQNDENRETFFEPVTDGSVGNGSGGRNVLI
jgi:hypothetical protein